MIEIDDIITTNNNNRKRINGLFESINKKPKDDITKFKELIKERLDYINNHASKKEVYITTGRTEYNIEVLGIKTVEETTLEGLIKNMVYTGTHLVIEFEEAKEVETVCFYDEESQEPDWTLEKYEEVKKEYYPEHYIDEESTVECGTIWKETPIGAITKAYECDLAVDIYDESLYVNTGLLSFIELSVQLTGVRIRIIPTSQMGAICRDIYIECTLDNVDYSQLIHIGIYEKVGSLLKKYS